MCRRASVLYCGVNWRSTRGVNLFVDYLVLVLSERKPKYCTLKAEPVLLLLVEHKAGRQATLWLKRNPLEPVPKSWTDLTKDGQFAMSLLKARTAGSDCRTGDAPQPSAISGMRFDELYRLKGVVSPFKCRWLAFAQLE